MINCNKQSCPLYGQVVVEGEGHSSPSIIIIGEAPGREEVAQRRPFVGPSGFLLRCFAEALDYPRYITYMVKCRPQDESGKDRPPTQEELECCRGHLIDELAGLNPKVIMLMGKTAIKQFLPELGGKKIDGIRGVPVEKHGVYLLPTYHPAAGLYKEININEIYKADFQTAEFCVASKYQKGVVPYRVIMDIATGMEILYQIEQGKPPTIAIDFEVGIDFEDDNKKTIWSKDTKLLICSFCYGDEAFVIPIDHKESPFLMQAFPRDFIRRLLINRKFTSHSVKFELEVLNRHNILRFNEANFDHDTLLMAHYYDENLKHKGLKFLVSLFFPEYAGYADEIGDITDTQGWEHIPLDILAKYGATDAFTQFKLFNMFREKCPDFSTLWDNVLQKGVRLLAEIEARGFPVEISRIEKMLEEKRESVEELKAVIQQQPEIVQALAKLTTEKKPVEEFNIGSPIHMRTLLFDVMEKEAIKFTKKTGAPAADKQTIQALMEDNLLLHAIQKVKEEEGLCSKFLEPLKSSHVEGRIHSSYSMHITVTGRLSSSSPNLQNIKKDSAIRNLFVPSPGNILLKADYSQIELRILAQLSGDEEMMHTFRSGGDIHEATMNLLSLTDRRVAKAVNFGMVYGMSPGRLAKDLGLTHDYAESIINNFFKKYPMVKALRNKVIQEMKTNGFITSPMGRKRRIKNIWSDDMISRLHAENQTMNTNIQSVASDITILAAYDILQQNIGNIVNLVHDEIVMEIPLVEESLLETCQKVKSLMENVRLPFDLSIPLKADVSIGDSWGNTMEVC